MWHLVAIILTIFPIINSPHIVQFKQFHIFISPPLNFYEALCFVPPTQRDGRPGNDIRTSCQSRQNQWRILPEKTFAAFLFRLTLKMFVERQLSGQLLGRVFTLCKPHTSFVLSITSKFFHNSRWALQPVTVWETAALQRLAILWMTLQLLVAKLLGILYKQKRGRTSL